MSDQNISTRIAEQNDRFRKGDRSIPGKIVMTPGIAALQEAEQQAVFAAVRSFNDFTAENDPYGEHDCCAIEIAEVGTILFKIDYYDVNYAYGSESPVDLSITRRVLTIMLAAEY